MNGSGAIRVTKQVLINFSIGKYTEQVSCDVVPMQASHLLLGRPWEYDRTTNHDGRSNKYKLVKNGKSYTLAPLPPSKIHKYQQQFTEKMIEWENQQKAHRKMHKPEPTKGKSELIPSNKVKKGNFYASMRDVDRALNNKCMLILLYFKEALVTTNELPSDLPP